LKPSKTIPDALLDSLPGYIFKMEVVIDELERCITMIAIDNSRPQENFGALMLDIDRVSQRLIEPAAKSLPDVLEGVHEDVWGIFEQAKNENLDALLNGEKRGTAA
jgi:hypothetical protein